MTDSYDHFGIRQSSPSIKPEPTTPFPHQSLDPSFDFPSYDTYNAEQILNSLIFPEPHIKAEYNPDIASRLDALRNLMDTDGISPQQLNIDIDNDQQLAQVNHRFQQILNSIESDGAAAPVSYLDPRTATHGEAINNNYTHSSMSCENAHPYTYSPYSDYTNVMLQSFNFSPPESVPTAAGCSALYPSPEQDMYVRSHPMPPGPMPMEFDASATNNIYGDVSFTPEIGAVDAMGYPMQTAPHQPVSAYMGSAGMMTGSRYHYTTVPGIAASGFEPEIRTSLNFTSGKDSTKYKSPSPNPAGSESQKEEASESFKPVKATIQHEEKKNMATLVNVFASSGDTTTELPKTVTETSRDTGEKKEEGKQNENENRVSDKKASVAKDVLDLLVSDFEDLSIEKLREETLSEEKCDTDKRTVLYPKSVDEKRTDTRSKMNTAQHVELLRQIEKWVNESYARRKKNSESVSSNLLLSQRAG
ncbi:hypothetical protein EC973_002432 [Apophysomyces ossiformis]|uniref:Uncharacterized protein n=1 Tax=Apophysomyces ossiformis TaxID=679940 RepID=A0A8H7ENN1_9FUNG|nr:hypothetical protein EC973_002432 [Apophysomyces ossiformis]